MEACAGVTPLQIQTGRKRPKGASKHQYWLAYWHSTIKHFSDHSNELEACAGGTPVQIQIKLSPRFFEVCYPWIFSQRAKSVKRSQSVISRVILSCVCQNGEIIRKSCLQRSKHGYLHTINHFSGHSNELEACTGGTPVQIQPKLSPRFFEDLLSLDFLTARQIS